MGLLYIIPCSEEEREQIEITEGNDPSITLKSYGLPRIFWLYFLCSCSIIFLMVLAVKEPMIKLFQTQDPLNIGFVSLVLATLVIIPISLLAFFVYEKRITKGKNQLTISHYVLGIKVIKKTYTLSNNEPFAISQFAGSPNIARVNKDPKMRAFENQGYFELFGCLENGERFLLDRNNRKADLVRISNLLKSY
jgi:hypothetical protein